MTLHIHTDIRLPLRALLRTFAVVISAKVCVHLDRNISFHIHSQDVYCSVP